MFSLSKAGASLALFSILSALDLSAAPPVIDPFDKIVPADVPAGKSLVIPVSVTEGEGALTFKVTSSNPVIQARVKTGNPILRLHVVYEGSPAFEGDLDLQLYRDLAPITTGFISGFAQSGYYDNQIFHRVIKDFVVQGGDPLGTGAGGPGFVFEHEFQPSLIFSGLGQLAMANSAGGYNRGVTNGDVPSQVAAPQIGLGDFSPTNGSQFFITTSNQHGNLDFKHTIFGQLVRGWPLLAQINNVAVNSADKPSSNVRIQTARILPGRAEATILLGARGVGSSTITVTVEDAVGNKTSSTFTATGKRETINNRPIMAPLETQYADLNEFPTLFVKGFDLEQDRTSFGIAAVRQTLTSTNADFLPNFIGFASIIRSYGTIGVPGVQTFAVGVSGYLDDSAGATPFADVAARQGEFAPFASYGWQVQRFVVGKKPVRIEPVVVEATAATNASLVVGRFSDTNPNGVPATYSAQINWGDGTAVVAGTVARDTTRPGSGFFAVTGSHTYARPGIFTATAILNWNVPNLAVGEPAPEIARIRSAIYVSTAVAPLRVQGTTLDVKSSTGAVSNRILATFTDTNKSRRTADYVATVDWGDGLITPATVIKNGPGRFAVRGSHTYRDPETFPLSVRIHPAAAVNEGNDVVTWATLNLSGFTAAPHAPPFPVTNLRATWRSAANGADPSISKVVTGGLVNPYVPANLTVQLRGQLEVGNSGDKKSAQSTIRAYLSPDATLNTTGANADQRLVINGNEQVTVGALGSGVIVNTGSTPWVLNLPKGDSGGGKYFITEIIYSDPIINESAVPKTTVIRLPARVFGFDRSTNDFTTQDGVTKVTFKVVLDTLPTANVTIPITSSLTTQGTVSPASLVFTAANFSVPQTVTVTGVQDNNADTRAYSVTVGSATSSDPLYSGAVGFSLNLTNKP